MTLPNITTFMSAWTEVLLSTLCSSGTAISTTPRHQNVRNTYVKHSASPSPCLSLRHWPLHVPQAASALRLIYRLILKAFASAAAARASIDLRRPHLLDFNRCGAHQASWTRIARLYGYRVDELILQLLLIVLKAANIYQSIVLPMS